MPLSRARVSIEDRGFQFGDGVYEVLRVYRGRIFHLEDHLGRLEQSARAIGLSMVYSRVRWRKILTQAHARCGFPEAKLYIQITRGQAPRDHAFPRRDRPSVIVTARRMNPLDPGLYQKGVSVITLPDNRWGRCDIKSVNLLPNVMAKEKARAAGVFEALFVREGMVVEGSSCNIFAVIKGWIVAPPLGPAILPGITRNLVMGLARKTSDPLVEEEITLEEFLSAEEAFLTGTTIEVLPVVRVDGLLIGTGKPGKLTRRLQQQFLEIKPN